MKKIIIAIIIFLGVATTASAFYSDNALVNIWNSRPDLQKVFPGDPTNNSKLETWAKKYGWKETPDLFNYYPDKAIVEKIIDNKTNDRITALETQVANLTARLSQIQPSQTTIIQQTTQTEGTWKLCRFHINGGVSCPLTDEETLSSRYDNGSINYYVLIK